MDIYTLKEVETLRGMMNSFDAFLEHIGTTPHVPTLDKILSDERVIEVEREGLETVRAWIAWQANFNDTTTLWMEKPLEKARESVGDIRQILERLGKFSSLDPKAPAYRDRIEMLNLSLVYARAASQYAGRGMSLHYCVVKGVDRESKLMDEIKTSLLPTMGVHSKGKMILLP